jgi:hypothetical protein
MESEILFEVALLVAALLVVLPTMVMNRGANRWWRIFAWSGLVIFFAMIVVAWLFDILS